MNEANYDKWRETDGSLIDPDARPHYDPDDQLDPFEEDLDDQLDPFEEDPEATTNKPYYQDNWATLYLGDSLKILKELPDNFIQTCVTSPPYWGLRDYGTAAWEGGDSSCPHQRMTKISKDTATGHKGMFEKGQVVGDAIYKSVCPECGAVRIDDQLGLESTPEQYVDNMVLIFREVWRVLKKDGTLWLNLGDSYCGTGSKGDWTDPKHKDGRNGQVVALNNKIKGLKPKDLVGIPWRVAFALQADGWYLRSDIIWAKPNPMPESVTDRPTKSHEHIFLMSKSKQYYYDAEAIKEETNDLNTKPRSFRKGDSDVTLRNDEGNEYSPNRNKRDVWTVNTHSYKEAHFATFPPKLIEPCILAGTPKEGLVLDPFAGSGTVAFVSKDHNRKSISIDLNAEYLKIQKKRLEQEIFNFNSGMERNGSQYLAKVKGQQHIPSGWDTSVGSGGHTKLTGRYVKKLKD